MVVAENTPRALENVLVNRHRLSDVVPRAVAAKAFRIYPPKVESKIMLGTKRASCVRYGCAEERLGFSMAI